MKKQRSAAEGKANEEVATAMTSAAPVRCHRLSGGAPVRCRVLPCVRPHPRMAFMSNGLRMGGLTQGKTLQQMGAMHSANGGDAFGK